MRLLVAGASGFIGRNLIRKTPKNWNVVATFNSSTDFPDFVESLHLDRVVPMHVNLASKNQIRSSLGKMLPRYDYCVYLAGNTNIKRSTISPDYDLKSNVNSLINLVNEVQIDQFILMSSGAVYDGHIGRVGPATCVRPQFPYAITKSAQEQYVLYFHNAKRLPRYQILRFFGAYGPHEPERKIYSRLVKAFCFDDSHEFEVAGDGRNLIDAMFVGDAIEGILKVIDHGTMNSTIDFASGTPMTVNDLVSSVEKHLRGKGVRILHSGDTTEYIRFRASSKEMRSVFGFQPRTRLPDGLDMLAAWLERNDKK